MRTHEKEANVKINLSVPKAFANLLEEKAHNDYMKTATWIKQFLMKNLLKDKETTKCINPNGK